MVRARISAGHSAAECFTVVLNEIGGFLKKQHNEEVAATLPEGPSNGVAQTALSAELQELIREFAAFATISGRSGDERGIAAYVKQQLAAHQVQITEDEAAAKTGGNQGNLIIVPEDFRPAEPAIAFLAHLDTVRDTGETQLMVKGDRVTSAGPTQLGADNRWGLTLLMRLLREYESLPDAARPNLILACTVGEEAGMLGAKALDLSPWKVREAVVLDSSLRPGAYIESCAGMSLFEAAFTGRAAHSAVRPNEGVSAVMMAARSLSRIGEWPHLETVMANIGGIRGGDLSLSNVIPAVCRFTGEVRGFSAEAVDVVLKQYRDLCEEEAARAGGKLSFSITPDFTPYRLDPKSPFVRFIRESMMEAGLTPLGVTYSGGSDANALNAAGIPAVNLGIGAQNPHADDEFILLRDMESCLSLIRALLNQSRTFLRA